MSEKPTQIVPQQEESSEKELIKLGKKFSKWAKLYMDKSDPKTYGNATQCALVVYGSKNYHTAAAIGHQNYKKLQLLGLVYEELDGRGVADWWKVAASKALKGSYEQTIDFMERLGIIDRTPSGNGATINQQFNFGDLAEEFARARKNRGLPVDDKA